MSKLISKSFPIKSFKTPAQWRAWLEKNHAKSEGVWLQFFKKDSGHKSITHAGALDEALCYGWIDGQANSFDEKSWLQKFTPRRAKSIWSKKNTENVQRLIQSGKMHKAGMAEIEAAKADGRWNKAYDSPKNMKMPEDFLKELSKNKKARTFFESLNRSNLYSIHWRLQTAKKPETRQKRMQMILEMLGRGEKFH
jgi:uncharacterized protein YdeI (YjbR/CyaY-like superfamily)